MKTLKIQLRRDEESKWNEVNPILLEKEIGITLDTFKVKVGDGKTPWRNLPGCARTDLVKLLCDGFVMNRTVEYPPEDALDRFVMGVGKVFKKAFSKQVQQ